MPTPLFPLFKRFLKSIQGSPFEGSDLGAEQSVAYRANSFYFFGTCLVAIFVACIAEWARSGDWASAASIFGAHCTALLAMAFASSKGHAKLGVFFYLALSATVANYFAANAEGVFAPEISTQLVCIACCAFMLGFLPTLGLALLCAAQTYALHWAALHGALPVAAVADTQGRRFLFAELHIFLMCALALASSHFTLTSMRQAKRNASGFQAAFDNSPVPMVVVTASPTRAQSLIIHRCNASFGKLSSTDHPALPSMIFGNQGETLAFLAQLSEDGRSIDDFQISFIDGSGRERAASISMRPISWSHGKASVCTVFDLTESLANQKALREINATLETRSVERAAQLLKTQRELQAQEKLASLGAMVAGVAHELNTPIGNAKLTASTLHEASSAARAHAADGTLKKSELNKHFERSQEACALLSSSLDRASELISQFKQISADRSSSARRHFYLGELCKDTLSMHAPALRRSPCTIEADFCETDSIELDSYPGPLGQVLSNLINNSLLHAFDGRLHGRIELSISKDKANSHALIHYRDDGVGIPESILPRVFDPFYTTKLGQGGTGLGLYIAHNIVFDLLGGTLVVESNPDTGSSFSLKIPLVSPK